MKILKTRVIPVLLLKNNGLYKGIKFKKHSYVGDPHNALKIFNEKEVDELVIMDITATNEQKSPNFELLEEIACEAFMPMAYGGGLKSLEDIDKIFSIGYEKVILNTCCSLTPELITEASKKYGAQSIVAAIDVKKNFRRGYTVYTHSGSVKYKKNPVTWARELVELGAGELLVNSIDRDGTMNGYDTNIIEMISSQVSVPVVAAGGAGSIKDFAEAQNHGASAVAAGAMFVYQGPHRAVLINYPSYDLLLNTLGDE